MAIQMRRGEYANFDPSKLLPGEWAVVQDGDPEIASGKAVYMCFAAGDVRRLTTIEDLQSIIADLTDDVIAEIRDELNTVKEQAQQAATSANAATATANAAADAAGQASERATAAAEAAEGVVIDAIPTMTANIKGGAKLGNGLRVDDDTLSVGNLVQSGSGTEVVTDGCAIYSVEGEGWSEQDGTPTPENPVEIEVCRGRNLLVNELATHANVVKNADGSITVTSVPSSTTSATIKRFAFVAGQEYTLSGGKSNDFRIAVVFDSSHTYITAGAAVSFTAPTSGEVAVFFALTANAIVGDTIYPQLELGSTPTPYVPYGCVGLEVRDSQDALVSCTPIPLPSKGFAASLPDGTSDALSVDSAGRWEWTNQSDEVVFDGGSVNKFVDYLDPTGSASGRRFATNLIDGMLSIGDSRYNVVCSYGVPNSNTLSSGIWSVGNMCTNATRMLIVLPSSLESISDANTWLSTHNVAVLYPLATPTTESGYIDLPDLPEGATVSIPELREIGCSWFIAGVDELAQHATNWGKRALASESRIAALEAAVAELATS